MKTITSVQLLVLLLLLLPIAAAVGLRPGRIDMNYVSVPGGFEKTFPYHISNTLNVPITAEVYSFYEDGSFEGAFTISKTEFQLGPFETQPFFVTLKLPENVTVPGESRIGISAAERDRKASRGATIVQGAVASVFHINGLYQGKYVGLSLSAAAEGTEKPVRFTLEAKNLGTENIIDLRARIAVYQLPNNFITEVEALRQDSGPLSSWYSTTFTAELAAQPLQMGLYRAVATVFYDGEQKQVESFFRIGSQGITIVSYPREALGGQIHRFPLTIESQYNLPYQSVVADVTLKNKETLAEVRSFRTDAAALQPFETKELLGYLDLKGIPLGVYTMTLLITYDGEMVAMNDDFKVTDDHGNTEVRQRAGGFVAQKPKKRLLTTTNILIGVIVLLLAVNLLWFLRGRRRNQPEQGIVQPEHPPELPKSAP